MYVDSRLWWTPFEVRKLMSRSARFQSWLSLTHWLFFFTSKRTDTWFVIYSYAYSSKPVLSPETLCLPVPFCSLESLTSFSVYLMAISHNVTPAISVSQNYQTAVMLVYYASSVGIKVFSYVKPLFQEICIHGCLPCEWKRSFVYQSIIIARTQSEDTLNWVVLLG